MAEKNLKTIKARMKEILRILAREYPEATCSLHYETPFQLLIATILSAQCTDERVNCVTVHLFKKFPDALTMAQASLPVIEKLIKTTGFFRAKAKSIHETSRIITEQYGGKIPSTLEELIQLRGVGRKTANVLLGTIFNIPGIVVDTHVKRITNRMGFTQSKDPIKIEQELMKIIPKKSWIRYSHQLIQLGRTICKARKPQCYECSLSFYCPEGQRKR